MIAQVSLSMQISNMKNKKV